MLIKRSMSLSISNFSVVYKILIYRVIVFAITVSLSAILILPSMMFLIRSEEVSALLQTFSSFFKDFFLNNNITAYGDLLKTNLQATLTLIENNIGHLVLAVAFSLLVTIASIFLNGISNFIVGGTINDYMSSRSNIGFIRCFFKNLRQSINYELVYMLFMVPFQILVFAFNVMLFILLLSSLNIFAPMIILGIYLALITLQMTLFCNLMPILVNEKIKPLKACKKSFNDAKKGFLRLYSNMYMALLLIFIVNLACAVFSFFLSILITVPLSFLFLTCISFVNYYDMNNKKYYIEKDVIVGKSEKEENEQNYNELDM